MQELLDKIVSLENENEKLKRELAAYKAKYEPSAPAEVVKEIVDYLNAKANKSFRHNNSNTKGLISARLAEGHTIADLKLVIDHQCAKWLGDEEMEQYLRPSTLFRASKFEGYLNNEKKTRPVSIGDIINAGRSV